MIKHLFAFIMLAVISLSLPAQTVKTGVLVIGNTTGGVAASIQSARSGAKTMYLTLSPDVFNGELDQEELSYLEKIRKHYILKNKRKPAAKDSISFNYSMTKAQYSDLIKSIADTTKNLTITLNTGIEKIEKDGKGWELRLKNGQKVKADVIVDATEKLSIASMVGVDPNKTMNAQPITSALFDTKVYRSTVATAYSVKGDARSVFPIAIGSFIPAGAENFVIVPKATATFKPVNMSAGQAAGTIAAYCAFFKTTTKSVNVRGVQTELLTFDAQLIPFADIKMTDPNFMSYQKMGVSGLLKPILVKEDDHTVIKFDTAGTVSSEELRMPMREFYTRSQIWFADNKKDVMTLEDVISLFMFTATRGDELKREIEEGWKESFKFNTKFDMKRPVSRKEFAILADKYVQPYNVRVDFAGNLVR